MVSKSELKSALESKTDYSEVTIEENSFVYAMVSEDTGLKFEEQRFDDEFAYNAWKDNDLVDQDFVKNDLSALVAKAKELYTELDK
jgi:hypothetical protein